MSDGQQRLAYVKVSPEGVETMRRVEHFLNALSGLDSVVLEMVRLRISVLNGCEFCIGLHQHELEKRHEPATRIAAALNPGTGDALTRTEMAALRWAEVVTNVQTGHVAEEEFEAARAHFSEKELVDLTIAVGSINAWNRMAIAFRPQWEPEKVADKKGAAPLEAEMAQPAEDDGGKISDEGETAR